MNKNTVIAFILSISILIVWSIFIRKQATPPQKKIDLNFSGIKQVSADYKNGYIKVTWNPAEAKSQITYGIFFKEKEKISDFNRPAYYTDKSSMLIQDLDLSKDYYFAVKAYDANGNTDKNTKQFNFKSQFKSKGLQERVVKFENQEAVYYLSTLGGRIKNIVLKKYKTIDNKEQVNLLKYSKPTHRYYYTLDLKVMKKDDNYDLLQFNDLTAYQVSVNNNKITFKAVLNKELKIIKEYIFAKQGFLFQKNVRLKQIAGRTEYNQIVLKWQPTLGPENKMDQYNKLQMGYYAAENLDNVNIKKKKYNKVLVKKEDKLDWITFHNRYFVAAIMPDETFRINESVFSSDGAKHMAGIVSMFEPGKLKKELQLNYTIYAGPKIRDTFKNSKRLNSLRKTISQRSFILGIGKMITKLGNVFLDTLIFIYGLVKSYGLAIIIFTILIKILLYPLTHKQFESMGRMQKIQPVINQVREQYKNDAQRMNKELMQVYKKYKVNPFGGCLPLILQIPIFFAIWDMLQYSLELRSASFLWIKSLALPDTIGHLGSIPINILPLVMGATMLLQQTQTSTDPKQKSMMYILPIVFLFFFWKMPSGLVLYWTIQNILSIVQQSFIKKYQKVEVGGAPK